MFRDQINADLAKYQLNNVNLYGLKMVSEHFTFVCSNTPYDVNRKFNMLDPYLMKLEFKMTHSTDHILMNAEESVNSSLKPNYKNADKNLLNKKNYFC